MGWFNRRTAAAGSVLFRGSIPPRVEDFAYLGKLGIRGGKGPARPELHWSLKLEHPHWGKAVVFCARDFPPLPAELIDWDARLTHAEKESAKLGECAVSVKTEGLRENVLHDRKLLLRWLRTVMGDDGVVALDHTAQRMWSRGALDDELAHDADLDIDGLYTLHAVTAHAGGEDDDPSVQWLHTHGLAEIGFFDFDILRPAPALLERGLDSVRAMAFGIAEGKATLGGTYDLCSDGSVRLVDVPTFLAKADPECVSIRSDPGGDHVESRAVLCNPVGGLGKLFGGKPVPVKLLSELPEDADLLVNFSNDATELMAERARKTYPFFRALAEDLAEFEFNVIAKIGYVVDGGRPDEREHLWFQVHQFFDDAMDATLGCQPLGIARMREGDRGTHPVELLTDWAIISPIGMINPRDTSPARAIRERREEFRALMREAKELAANG